ncbi:arsenite efflux transporter metallochaperone ArsD [Paenibacillus thiaminolyticus]|uniref:Arsenite efflux transporter metallochaperone ArsD n=1 Tax=Paenibacillus thiaminolyticus TaxID=49283 RepID=A0AAP9DW05_PANTH|nr:arsenite efflux transporter metallochaperone ArsD [Paenibacillus thiaminolyticus]MCY9538978.1 arsenite efflux transporter metallochaperone ArsD [Paenibacillus thiaminolyticus]MCY9604236.1 arsenite efflux transporter metallochaperone ArsD [Paenibacillus thiaminolyticus]MCY9608089.1 arsenite efflux transporter metallochaperone ArsD [Paenibacillus thiaminolyticus]MCY9612928.1 arsenite efflux transporter metallochaperone ArsD [Paenibacillus thiaminolyticus]MCY9622018.1 arsenite efflux transport
MSVKIEIFDPALCCSTGVCGPSVDPALIQVANAIEQLKKQNIDIHRYNLSQDVDHFVSNTTISSLLQQHGPEILPVTLVNGEIRKKQCYPTNQELEEWGSSKIHSIGKKPLNFTIKTGSKDCCEPGSGCC